VAHEIIGWMNDKVRNILRLPAVLEAAIDARIVTLNSAEALERGTRRDIEHNEGADHVGNGAALILDSIWRDASGRRLLILRRNRDLQSVQRLVDLDLTGKARACAPKRAVGEHVILVAAHGLQRNLGQLVNVHVAGAACRASSADRTDLIESPLAESFHER
jgi:hypothetical protein